MFQSSGTNLYMQDLTLKNALDYYGALSGGQVGGRAAVIQDSGNRTIFKNVKMLSCQVEEHVQQLALSAREAWVVTGCIDTDASNWVTDVSGRPIAVPEGFFKAVLLRRASADGEGEVFEARAWVVENRSYGFSGFEGKASALEVSIDELEGIIGLDLFPNLVGVVGPEVDEMIEGERK